MIDRPLIWKNSNDRISATAHPGSDSLHVWFYGGVFGVGVSNGAVSGWTKCNRNVGEDNALGVIRLVII